LFLSYAIFPQQSRHCRVLPPVVYYFRSKMLAATIFFAAGLVQLALGSALPLEKRAKNGVYLANCVTRGTTRYSEMSYYNDAKGSSQVYFPVPNPMTLKADHAPLFSPTIEWSTARRDSVAIYQQRPAAPRYLGRSTALRILLCLVSVLACNISWCILRLQFRGATFCSLISNAGQSLASLLLNCEIPPVG